MVTISIAIVGAGDRGSKYAAWVREHPERARIVAVADPNAERREDLAATHALPADARFESWQELVAAHDEHGPLADAVIVATQDAEHTAPAVALLERGYHMLLEKPLAPTLAECRQIANAASDAGRVFAVGHVLRYAPYTVRLREMLPEIGRICSVQHLEPVGWWHMAHSFVRGNWRNEAESAPMLLAKSCHDLDWLEYVVGSPIASVASFGRLSWFTPENRPADAADRCLDCPLERTCPYSATRIYLDTVRQGHVTWPISVLTQHPTEESVTTALREGPYGRCVYACDNDVVDHQVVALEFADGVTGTFTMTAFSEHGHRKTRVFGSHGRIECDGTRVSLLDFRTGNETFVDVTAGAADAAGGHAGGDAGLMDAFVAAVSTGDATLVASDAASSLRSHEAVFAAERSRRERVLVDLPDGIR